MTDLVELVLNAVADSLDRRPKVQLASANLAGKGGGGVDTRQYNTDQYGTLDVTPPPPLPPAQPWFEEAVARMMGAPDPPPSPTEAARLLQVAMRNAHVRGQVDAAWTAGTLVNKLRDTGWFEKA